MRSSIKYPIIFVFDSDGECVLKILERECTAGWNDIFTSLNIAIDEEESWRLADQTNFELIPKSVKKMSKNRAFDGSRGFRIVGGAKF